MNQHDQMVVVLDFGSQYSQLIARRVREAKVYCEIHPFNLPAEKLAEMKVKGIILSGGPANVYDEGAPICDKGIFDLGIPILGICYGMQLMAYILGGKVEPAKKREYGFAKLQLDDRPSIFKDLPDESQVWMSHGDRITHVPPGFKVIAHTPNSPIAAMADEVRKFYGLQFHPEVKHTAYGPQIISNFLFEICGCSPSWDVASFVETSIREIKKRVGDEKVLCAVSGGVDSTTLAALVHKAIGDKLVCVFVDTGLMRLNEGEEVRRNFARLGIKLNYIDAGERFLDKLRGVVDPERKRKIIGEEFIAVFADELKRLGKIKFLAQGTLYPDVIESVSVKGPSATIKTHHNVGGLPDVIPFELIEPFRELFKDEVRAVGRELGIPEEILGRHPFPGPGLAIRVIGEVTRERLEVLRQADAIFIEEIRRAGIYDEIWQAFAVLLPVKSVGVMGDERTYESVIALRAVTSVDGMTADWARIPYHVLNDVSNRIINEVKGVNRVVYDISSKPPSTIEWE